MTQPTSFLFLSTLIAMSACSGGGKSGGGPDAGVVIDIDAMVVQPDATVCPTGTVECAGRCIAPLTDRDYCGTTTCTDDASDGVVCDDAFICDGAGSCVALVCEAASGTGGCNPLTQVGCAVGEKCSQLVSNLNPFLASTACVPDGNMAAGASCTSCAAGATGYDNCVAGQKCQSGRCAGICTSAGGDTCRTAADGFGEGTYCTLFANLFSDEIGLCVNACDPTDDTLTAGAITNNQCSPGEGCYLNVGRGVASCSGVPSSAIGKKQNDECGGPAPGSCYLNGCDSGFFPGLPNALGQAATTNNCSRSCTPVDTYIGQIGGRSGADDKCSAAAMQANGSGALGGVVHECRFIQTLFAAPLIPASQGMCMPVTPWYNCAETYDFNGILAAINGAANMAEANTAFNNFCYGVPEPSDTLPILPKCDGIGFGCTSLATRQPIFDALDGAGVAPANNQASTEEWLKARLAPTKQATRF